MTTKRKVVRKSDIGKLEINLAVFDLEKHPHRYPALFTRANITEDQARRIKKIVDEKS